MDNRWYSTRIEFELQMSLPVLVPGSYTDRRLARKLDRLQREIAKFAEPDPRMMVAMWYAAETSKEEAEEERKAVDAAVASLEALEEFVSYLDEPPFDEGAYRTALSRCLAEFDRLELERLFSPKLQILAFASGGK